MNEILLYTPSLRQQFIDRLPPRDSAVGLKKFNRLSDLSFIHSPLQLFEFLSFVEAEDVATIFSTTDMSFLYTIADVRDFDIPNISKAAISSVGAENVFDIAHSLVSIPKKPVSVGELITRVRTGLRLGSQLPIDMLGRVITEYSNIARVDSSYADNISNQILGLFKELSYVFSTNVYNNLKTLTHDADGVAIIEEVVSQDFAAFIAPIKNKDTVSSQDGSNVDNIASNLTILRREAYIQKQMRIVNVLDQFVRKLGFQWDNHALASLGAYVLVDSSAVLERYSKLFH